MKEEDFKTKKDHENHLKNLQTVRMAIRKRIKNSERVNRVNIVNEIIKEIASRGRKFFYNEGKTAELVDKGKIYYKAEYGKIEMICLSVPSYNSPKGWFHGGTLLHLVKEFRDYIKNGEEKEYSALMSPHWGYPEQDMLAIREKASQLGYLVKQ